MRHRRLLVVAALLVFSVLSTGPAHADAYEEGKDLYDARNWAGALAKFQQATRENPRAKVYWMLGLTYLKLRNGAGAAQAFEQAQRLDPSIGFTDPAKFRRRLQRARALSGAGAVAAGVAGVPAAAPPAAPMGAAAQIFREPFLNSVARDVIANRRYARDYAGTITPGDLSRIQQIVDKAGSAGIDMRVVFMPATWATRLQYFVDRAFQFMGGGPRDALIVATPRGANARAGQIKARDMQRILVRNQGQFLASYGQGLYAIASDVAKVMGLKVERAASKKRIWIYVLAGVGGLILIIIIVAVVRARGRKAEEEAEYKKEYDRAIDMMEPVADKLSSVQLSVQIVDDEDAKMLVRRAEANYFGAQQLLNKVPSPGKGEPDFGGVRRLAGMLHEASEALDKAEHIVSRKMEGKPVDLKQLEASGKKLGCYFCSRPLRDESAGKVVGLELKGQKMDVLACMNCFDEYSAGRQPKVRMVEYEGRPVHWSMVPGYDPWYDYYHYDRYRSTWVDAFVLATIFDWALWHSHPSPYVMWYPPGVYHYTYAPVSYNPEIYARDADVDAVIGSAWDTGGTPSGIEFAGPDLGAGAPYAGAPEAPAGADVS